MTRILVVDPNEAFATLLSEELQRQQYDVTMFYSGSEVLAAARKRTPDLVVLDMALEDPGALELAQELRAYDARIRLMLIPFMGETLVPEAEALQVQGVLSKPFFIPDLPAMIEQALQSPLPGEVSAPPAPEPEPELAEVHVGGQALTEAVAGFSPQVFETHRREVQRQMGDLLDELGAEGVLLTHDDTLVVWVGRLDNDGAAVIGRAVADSWCRSTEIAAVLGAAHTRLELSLTSDDSNLYALSVSTNLILTVVARGAAALGLVRHRARRAANAIEKCCLE